MHSLQSPRFVPRTLALIGFVALASAAVGSGCQSKATLGSTRIGSGSASAVDSAGVEAPAPRDLSSSDPALRDSAQEAQPEAGGTQQPESDKPSAEDLAFAVEAAQRELSIASLESQSSIDKAERAVAKAEVAAVEARRALSHFEERDAPQKVGEAEIGLSRAESRLMESRDELNELEAMYSEEQFAERTKELVLERGRRNLALAETAFALSQRELETLRDFTHVAKRAELTRALENAEREIESATAALEIAKAKADLSLLRKERAVTKAEKKLSDQ